MPPAKNPETRIATKRGRSQPTDPPARHSPALTAPSEAWERVCRPSLAIDGAVQTSAPPAVDAPSICGPDRLLPATGCGGGSEQGSMRAAATSVPSPRAGPPQQQSAADGDHGGTVAQADGASGWDFWADWATEGWGRDDGGCWSGGGGSTGGGGDEVGGAGNVSGGGEGGGGDGGGSGSGDSDDWDPGAAATDSEDEWLWMLHLESLPSHQLATTLSDPFFCLPEL